MKRLLLLGLTLAACSKEPVPPPTPECDVNVDCGENMVCAPDQTCQMGECSADADCIAKDPRKICVPGTLSCIFTPPFSDECDNTRPCVFGEFCSTLLGSCHTSSTAADCTRRGQCPAGQTCDKDANKCVADPGCYGDRFCEESEICDLMNHECTQVSIECARCTSEGACNGNAVCNSLSRECVAPGNEASCRTGEQCDPLRRCVQCLNDDQCGPGTFCNAALGKCESNVQCVDDPSQCPSGMNVRCVTCVEPEICDRRTRQCQAPATPCDDDIDCPGLQYCNKELDPPVCAPRIPDCLNDLQEPNNRPAQARLLDATTLRFEELKSCPGDPDWYRLDVAAGTYLTVDVRFRHIDGDLEAQLFLADGTTLVDESRKTTDNERVEIAVGTDTTLLLRVFLAVPSVNPTPYELIVSRDRGDLCADDANENDDALGTAKPIVSDVPYDGRICSADPDWFVISNVPASTRITAHLDVTASLGDLDLELWRAGSTRPLLTSASTTDDEDLAYDASFAGEYFLRVNGKRADTNVYSLRVELREHPGLVCADDRFEVNNAPPEATRVPDMTLTNDVPDLSICGGDEDWFVVNLGPGEAVMADVGFDPHVDLELKLYGPGAMSGQNAPLSASNSVFGREHVAWRADLPGDHYVRVHGLEPDQISPYTMHIQRLPPLVCSDDFVDAQMRGNDQADPFLLDVPPTRIDDLSLCFGDSDWFQLFLLGGFTNVVRLHYIENDAILGAGIFGLDGTPLIATQPVAGAWKELALNVNGAGGVAVVNMQVQLQQGFETPYNITIDLIPLPDCEADRAEPNELLELASTITASTASPQAFDGLSLCSSASDEDWFEIHPPRIGARISARTIADSGDLFIELRGPSGTVRACTNGGNDRCYSDGNDPEELVTFTATTTRPYFLRVGSIYSNPALPAPLDIDTKYRLELEYDQQ